MAKIVILGAGMMGSAFSIPLADNGHNVSLIGTHLDGDIIEEIHESHYHPTLKAHLPDGVTPFSYDRLAEVMPEADLVVVGVNSRGVDWAAQMLGPWLSANLPVIGLTKGLAGDGRRLTILPELFRSGLPADYRDQVQLTAIGGPSLAGELAARHHTCVVLTGPNTHLLQQLAELLRTPYYHVWTNTDIIGVEVCVALKNIYTLAVGLWAGILEKEGGATDSGAMMHNPAAALFAQGLHETAYLVEVMGGQQSTVFALPGAGDLYVTCVGGRNIRMGRLLGLGAPYSIAKAQHMADITIEGAELALAIGPTVAALLTQGELDKAKLPLLQMMINIVCHNAPIKIPWDQFFA
jgi:glycerol-3-phosphate dehydrogenase (NAD(P)+)